MINQRVVAAAEAAKTIAVETVRQDRHPLPAKIAFPLPVEDPFPLARPVGRPGRGLLLLKALPFSLPLPPLLGLLPRLFGLEKPLLLPHPLALGVGLSLTRPLKREPGPVLLQKFLVSLLSPRPVLKPALDRNVIQERRTRPVGVPGVILRRLPADLNPGKEPPPHHLAERQALRTSFPTPQPLNHIMAKLPHRRVPALVQDLERLRPELILPDPLMLSSRDDRHRPSTSQEPAPPSRPSASPSHAPPPPSASATKAVGADEGPSASSSRQNPRGQPKPSSRTASMKAAATCGTMAFPNPLRLPIRWLFARRRDLPSRPAISASRRSSGGKDAIPLGSP